MDIADTLNDLIAVAESANAEVVGDYRDNEGRLICGKCHTPKTSFTEILGKRYSMPIRCKCKKDADESEEREKRLYQLLSSSGIPEKFKDATFAKLQTDEENAKAVRSLKRYADNFAELKKNNQGVLIFGSVGTGKTHIAVCAAHEIINQGYYVKFISLPQLLQSAKPLNSYEEDRIIREVESAELLIVDDLGAERNTDYALEFVYNIINTRCNSKKPLIVTTNLSFNEMSTTDDLRHARIYDRVFEACPYPIEFKGKSKRIMIAADKYDEMCRLLEDSDA